MVVLLTKLCSLEKGGGGRREGDQYRRGGEAATATAVLHIPLNSADLEDAYTSERERSTHIPTSKGM